MINMKSTWMQGNIPKSLVFLLFFLIGFTSFAQQEQEKAKKEAKKFMNEAQQALSDNDFATAEAAYRKAIAKDPANVTAKYNMGNLYYNREKTGEAQTRLTGANEVATSKADKHRISHNLGNSYMKQKKYKEAVGAYKEALRNDPSDDETRYNLALAKEKLKEQQQKNQNNKDNKDNKDQDKKDQNKDKKNKGDKGNDKDKDGQPKDKGDNKDQDKKDGKGDQDNKKQDQDNQQNKPDKGKQDQKGDPNKKSKQQQQPVQGQLSPQQIKNLLEAMNNEEEKTQDKINAEKAKGVKTKSEKDW